jgi:hypothetical protein
MPVLVLFRQLSLFAVLSLADLGLTGYLLGCGGGAYESNPVAAWWLEQFGWMGLTGFKLTTLALFAGVVVAVARRNPRTARRVVQLGCAALLVVVVYSSLLVPGVRADADRVGGIEANRQALDKVLLRQQAYAAVLNRLTNDLLYGRRSLAAAEETLAGLEEVRDPGWFKRMVERFPGYSLHELVSIRLILEAILSPGIDADQSAETARDLAAQFEACFGRTAPLPAPMAERKRRGGTPASPPTATSWVPIGERRFGCQR